MEICKRKFAFATEAEAQAECQRLRYAAKQSGEGGKSWKRLHTFACGKHFHIGRANSYAKLKPTPAKRIPTTGQLWRRLRRIEERIDKERQHRAFTLGQLIERDRKRYEGQL